MDQYGADALRWRMVSSPIMQGGELLIAKDGSDVREISRLIIKPIWNAYHFFTLYANADEVKSEELTVKRNSLNSSHLTNTLDAYIITKAMLSVAAIERAMDAYDVPSACKAGAEFFDALNNWYIRRSRDRFWKAEKDADKQAAYDTLYTVLSVMMRALAPLLPLTTEAIYRGLTGEESVHLTAFPYDAFVHAKDMHTDIVASMDKVREVCTAALSIRNNEQMRVRQPLASLTIVHKEADLMKPYADIIADELNVKEVKFVEGVEQYATHKIQPNFAVLGKRLKAEGKEEKMKQIIPAIKKNEYTFLGRGEIAVCGETLRHYDDEYTALLEPKNKQGTMALPAQDGLVVLDLALTPALKTEGYARDIIRMVQQARKDAGLQITDHITLTFKGDAELESAFLEWQKTIEEQTLAKGSIAEPANANYKAEEEIEGKKASVGVRKA
jgi:isoleucyl-tRNA synthetase